MKTNFCTRIHSAAIHTCCIVLAVLYSLDSRGNAEYFVEAIRYGAKDCSFCHTSATGGDALNERGAWLIEEQKKRNTETVLIEWLASRETPIEFEPNESSELTVANPTDPDTADKVNLLPNGPVDYTTNSGDWPSYNGDLHATKYSVLDRINAGTIADLKIAWVWESTSDVGASSPRRRRSAPDLFKGSPIVAGGRMFVRTRYSAVAAINPASGDTLWEFDLNKQEGPRPPMFGFTTRGLGYYQHEKGDRVILVTSDGWLIALDAVTGQPIEDFGNKGQVDLREGMRRYLSNRLASWSYAPLVCNGMVIVGSQTQDELYRRGGKDWNKNLPVGDVRGFDVITGEQRWVFETVPQGEAFGSDTWGEDSWKWMGNTNVWSSISCDPDLGFVYLPVTAPSHHMYGGHRPGDNLFGTSLVALDVITGQRKWHFQIVHHDVWDYDLPAAPVLAHAIQDGKRVDVVIQVTKTGFAFVFNRKTGEPIWPIEEREVPQSTLEGESTSPTQPFPTWPPPFEMQGITEEDLNDLTPEIKEQAKAMMAKANYGPLFSPIGREVTVILPGVGGGANWGGATFDPETRHLYVASRRWPMFATAIPAGADPSGIRYRMDWMSINLNVQGLPIVKPPWSSITAYSLDTGKIVFQIPNGAGPKDHELLQGLKLPDLGKIQEAPGLLVSADLIIHGSSKGWRESQLIARSKHTGEQVWEYDMPGSFAGAHPITYKVGDEQFVAVGTGSVVQPARIVAFKLEP